MSDDINIRAVLDTSAMLSYARGHVHVGEILVDVAAEEGIYAGLPAVALLAAHAQTLADEAAKARLGILAALPAVIPLTLGPTQAADVASVVELTDGDLALAHAVWAALEHHAYYLTTEPHHASTILTEDQVHPIPEADA